MSAPTMDAEAAIRDLIYRYAAAADARHAAAMARCFQPDAVLLTADGSARGRAEIERRFAAFLSGELMGTEGSSTHLVGNVMVEVSGESATAWSQAVVVLAPAGSGHVHVRGIGYDDECVRTADGWRFRQRQHRLLWQAQCPGGPVMPFLSSQPRRVPGDPAGQ